MSYRLTHKEKNYWVKESAKWGVEVHDLAFSPRKVVIAEPTTRKLLEVDAVKKLDGKV
jgi:hypothetical protein